MRDLTSDALMLAGAVIVILGWLLSSTTFALGVIAAGVAIAFAGYAIDWRNPRRALWLLAISVSWITVLGFAAFAVVSLLPLIDGIRTRHR